MTRVVNIRREKPDVYIGRGSPWGNPFRIGTHGNRQQVIELHWDWICGRIPGPRGETPPSFARIRSELAGKTLGCYCAPKPCHGDNYVALIEEFPPAMTLFGPEAGRP